MSGPDGTTTKRDQRRETRREQYRRTQAQRQRQRAQVLRRQAIQKWAIRGTIALAIVLVLGLIVSNLGHGQPQPQYVMPATGDPVDGMTCAAEVVTVHYHTELQIWVNGQQVVVPEGTGIVAPPGSGALASNGSLVCLYNLHVHTGAPNLIHIESAVDKPYTVANLFHVWGKQIGGGKFMGNVVDAKHPLVIEIYDAQGKLIQTYSGKPGDLVFKDKETFLIKYNSPNAKLAPYNWNA